ncbi:hypothetical protein [Brevibacillus sp. SKDU10]|uniref:hypothetical protein n=1 Tax=Brevibacillus sp. SKDU10 TaxID=1247872 RepID=UPI000AB3C966|nr:hypothetical protein [Brevibacillus sp. SKDU10]
MKMLWINIRILASKLCLKKENFIEIKQGLDRRKTTHTAKAEISGFGLPYLIAID